MTTDYTYQSTRKTAAIEGITVSYHEAGVGEPLILLHGSGPGVSAWSNFRYNLPVFAKSFRTIMPDMPGFGATDLPELNEYYPVLAARWIARLMDHLEHLTKRLNRRLGIPTTARIGFKISTGTKGPVMNGEALFRRFA